MYALQFINRPRRDMGWNRRLGREMLVAVVVALCISSSASPLSAQSATAPSDGGLSQIFRVDRRQNAQSCSGCHAAPSLGGSSRVTVRREEQRVSGHYFPAGQDGTLHLQDELSRDNVESPTGLRVTLDILGEGYIEAIPDQTFRTISAAQLKETRGKVHGEVTRVSLLEKQGRYKAVGHFGWKAQHASILSASADALHSELGVANQYFTDTPTAKGYAGHAASGSTADPAKLDDMVRFLRSSEPIAPDPERSATESARAGSKLFDKIGCSICHVRTLRAAPAGSKMLGGTMTVSDRVGDKEIHPFSDYLLHDVGTGDGIIQNIRPQDYDEHTANKFRTAPLWGLRFRSWLMHDGKSITYHQAIMRHSGEASEVIDRYEHLTPREKENIHQFLDSL